ncbi:MAG TPA: polysaccharide deacetylase family protein [Rhodothermales bacterium]|nr:polysaccharide deacetylase family protein [Rhodothermales bacterium]
MARFLPDLLWRVDTPSRTAFLTFDDGPTDVLTQPILDVLERYAARACFFLVGSHAARLPSAVQDLLRAGHVIGNHTFTHPDAWRTPPERLVAELDRTTATLEDLTGTAVRFMRPPYGHFTGEMRQWCKSRGQLLTMWDVMPGDFLAGATPQKLERFILKHIRPGSVIVLHDNPKARLAMPPALENVLRILTREGWQFPALDPALSLECR